MPAGNRLEFVLRPRIALGVAADKMHRPAEYDLIDGTAEEGFGALLQLPDEGADYIGERDRTSRQARAFLHQFGAENAFEGAHMPPLAAADVLGDGGAAIKDFVVVVAEKQDRGDGGVRILERNQQGTVLADGGDGRVRRPEIHPAIERHGLPFPAEIAGVVWVLGGII